MAQQMDRAGIFRGPIVGTALNAAPAPSKAKFVKLRFVVHDSWNREAKQWDDWRAYDFEAYGELCIIKTDGTINQMHLEPLVQFAGWDGDFSRLIEGCELNPVRFTVKEHNYTKDDGSAGRTFRVEFIDDYELTPGSGLKSNVAESDIATMNAQYGAQIRALKGNAQRNAPKPQGRPATPPPAAPAPAAFNAPDAVETAKRDQASIPF